jgi:hypothetical protein
LPILFHMTSVAPSSQGWRTLRACSVPAIMPVATSEAGCPSSGTHQGACGQSSTGGSTKAAPPSAGATAASQSHAPRTRSSSHAPVSFMMRSAISAAAGWLPGARQSGSSA